MASASNESAVFVVVVLPELVVVVDVVEDFGVANLANGFGVAVVFLPKGLPLSASALFALSSFKEKRSRKKEFFKNN